jgi:hypothetical protein
MPSELTQADLDRLPGGTVKGQCAAVPACEPCMDCCNAIVRLRAAFDRRGEVLRKVQQEVLCASACRGARHSALCAKDAIRRELDVPAKEEP